jgi:hypothetical protein
MKIYRCNKFDADLGAMLSWHASGRAAQAELRRFQKERNEPPCGPEGVEAVDVPTDRAGLLEWLNREFNADNG